MQFVRNIRRGSLGGKYRRGREKNGFLKTISGHMNDERFPKAAEIHIFPGQFPMAFRGPFISVLAAL